MKQRGADIIGSSSCSLPEQRDAAVTTEVDSADFTAESHLISSWTGLVPKCLYLVQSVLVQLVFVCVCVFWSTVLVSPQPQTLLSGI